MKRNAIKYLYQWKASNDRKPYGRTADVKGLEYDNHVPE